MPPPPLPHSPGCIDHAKRLMLTWPLVLAGCDPVAGSTRTQLTVDFATYNPLSLLLKDAGYLEQALQAERVQVKWVPSRSSSHAIAQLYDGTLDVGSTAAAASLLARMRGIPIQAFGCFGKPEWTAIVCTPNAAFQTPADLVGRRVAVAAGTDPHIFLVRALAGYRIPLNQVRLHYVDHQAGLQALRRGLVDAWVGLDPYIAKAELDDHHRLFYRKPEYISFGALNAKDDFALAQPGLLQHVRGAYEKARQHAMERPADLVAALQRHSGLSPEVLTRYLQRFRIDDVQVRQQDIAVVAASGKALQAQGIAPSGPLVDQVVAQLVSVPAEPGMKGAS